MVLPVHHAKSSVKSPIFSVRRFLVCAGTMASRPIPCPGRAPPVWRSGTPFMALHLYLWHSIYYVPCLKGRWRAAGLRLGCPLAVHTTSPDSPTAFSGIVRSECIYVDGKHESPQF